MNTRVFRWDLDKTYLVSDFESLRALLRFPFERAEDKVAIPGVVALIRGLRRSAQAANSRPFVYFVTASPPQIGTAIKEKLDLDGVGYDGIAFKDQMHHLVRGRFDALREQIGYKLTQLLLGAAKMEAGAGEYLFGDDWESDPFVYSLYADIIAGRVDTETTLTILEHAQVSGHYIRQIAELMRVGRPQILIKAIFVLRQRRTPDAELAVFRSRLTWFDNYIECALTLYHYGLLDLEAVLEVARTVGLTPTSIAGSFEAVVARGRVPRSALADVRRVLMAEGLSTAVPRANLFRVLLNRMRRVLPPRRFARRLEPLPDYATLVHAWTHHARKQRAEETAAAVAMRVGGDVVEAAVGVHTDAASAEKRTEAEARAGDIAEAGDQPGSKRRKPSGH